MSAVRTPPELNEPRDTRRQEVELRQYLVSASNELHLFGQLCEQLRRPMPPALKRAHAAVRAELRRLSGA